MRYLLSILFVFLLIECSASSIKSTLDINKSQYSLMTKTIDKEDEDKLKELLRSGFDVNAKNDLNETVLIYSLKEKNRQKMSKILLKHGADVDCENLDVLASVFLESDFSKDSLAQAIVDNSKKKPQAYVYGALRYGHHKLFNFLLDNGFTVKQKLSRYQINMYLANKRYKELQENISINGLDGFKNFVLSFMGKKAQVELVKIVDNLYKNNSFTDKQKETIVVYLKNIGEKQRAYEWFHSMKKNDNLFSTACTLSAGIGKTDMKACRAMMLFALGNDGRQSWAYLLLNRYEDTIQAAKSAIKKDKMYYTYANMAHAYLLLGKKKKAYEAYKNYFFKLNSVYALHQIKDDFDILTLNHPEKKALFDAAYNYCFKMDKVIFKNLYKIENE
jgi:uncharacterized protein YihD (DUF1040 family)